MLNRVTEEGVERSRWNGGSPTSTGRWESCWSRPTAPFRTDLTSVPGLFTWLVPKTGAHLPAALLHDGLFHPTGHPTYTSTEGRLVPGPRQTGFPRRHGRHRDWSAPALAGLVGGHDLDDLQRTGTGWSAAQRWWYRLAAGSTLAIVVYLGYCATFDLFDHPAPLAVELPWMGDRVWWLELVGGLAGALVVPLLLGLLWGRFRVRGMVVALGLALLLHVTLVLAVIAGGYRSRNAAPAPSVVQPRACLGSAGWLPRPGWA